MMLEVAVETDEEWDSSRPWARLARKAAEAAIAESRYPELLNSDRSVEISVTFTGDEQFSALNAEWRGKEKPTNVLSFPMSDERDLGQANFADPRFCSVTSFSPTEFARQKRRKRVSLSNNMPPIWSCTAPSISSATISDEAQATDMESAKSAPLRDSALPTLTRSRPDGHAPG